MKTSNISELKQELSSIPHSQLVELCLRLAKFKKENKELLSYLLFEAHDEFAYLQAVKKEMDELFSEINQSNLYFAKKTIRKILRITNKYIRYSGSKTVETELLLYFCSLLKESWIPFQKSTALGNLYDRQIHKIKNSIKTFHEDLQFDYQNAIQQLHLDE